MIKFFVSSFFIISCFFLTAHEASFFYPVVACNAYGEKSICCIYQKSLNDLELWLYNIETRQMQKGLWSIYTPAGVKFSPDGNRFSFIDNGRIRVHSFLKRSARSLEFNEPLYDVASTQWASNRHCYFSAKQYGHYAIFQSDMDGNIAHILSASDADYLYPQKIENHLFVVKRAYLKSGYRYQIVKVPYKESNKRAADTVTDLFGASGDVIVGDGTQENSFFLDIEYSKREALVLNAGSQVVAFLSMISSTSGFFVRFKVPIDQQASLLKLSYYGIYKKDKMWRSHELFTFNVPTALLFGSERLHESLLPLLPRYCDGSLYYTSVSSNDSSTLYKCDLFTGQIKWIGCPDNFSFAPLFCEGKLFYGLMQSGGGEPSGLSCVVT